MEIYQKLFFSFHIPVYRSLIQSSVSSKASSLCQSLVTSYNFALYLLLLNKYYIMIQNHYWGVLTFWMPHTQDKCVILQIHTAWRFVRFYWSWSLLIGLVICAEFRGFHGGKIVNFLVTLHSLVCVSKEPASSIFRI